MVNNQELSDLQANIIKKIANFETGILKALLAQLNSTVDFVDEGGMSPLQNACFRGNKEAVQCLLDQGADVHFDKHISKYSALHFAALSGNKEVCLMILMAGADPQAVNSMSRTASQMAAFVNAHATVATINNFIPKSELLEYFNTPSTTTTTATQDEKQTNESYLPVYLLDAFHHFVVQSNFHPVRIVLNLQKFGSFNEHLNEMRKILSMMVYREMQRKNDVNEIMAFKYHYLGWIVSEIIKCRDYFKSRKDNNATNGGVVADSKTDYCELFAKRVLKENQRGELEYLELAIRDCVREFPFRECTIFRQVVTQLANKKSGPALDVIRGAINGQRVFVYEIVYCNTCGEENPDKKCSKCKEVEYCDRECQRLHWFMHKKTCARPTSTTTTTAGGGGSSSNVVTAATLENTKEEIDTLEITEQLQNLVSSG